MGVGMFGQRDANMSVNADEPAGAPALPVTDSAVPQPVTATSYGAQSFSSASLESPMQPSAPVTAPAVTAPVTVATTDDLVSMKQEALQHLQPLVGTLKQSPEEEFRTLMMMIQATDDKTMLKKALESAKKIKDDKVRAQAMLDVINEINYFTQGTQE